MKVLIKLGQKIEDCKRHMLDQGYNFGEADEFVKLVLEEIGLNWGLFDDIEISEINNAIMHLDREILK